MRWLTYFILAYATLGLQVGLGDYVSYQGAAPNLVLLAVIFIAVNAPKEAALLGAFSLGVLQDLLTQQPPGLYAFAYGIVGVVTVSTKQLVENNHPLTHLSMALVGGLISAGVLLLHAWLHPPGPASTAAAGAALAPIRLRPGVEFTRVLYTAVLAPFVLWLLNRFKRPFSFKPERHMPRIRSW